MPRRRRRWRGALLTGLALGLVLAVAVDRLRGERWEATAVVGLDTPVSGPDLAVDARLAATAPFRDAVRARLEAAVVRALARPAPLARLRDDLDAVITAAVERLAGPTLARSLTTSLGPPARPGEDAVRLRLRVALADDGHGLDVHARAPTAEAAAAVAEAAAATVVAGRERRRAAAIARRLDATEAALADTRRRLGEVETALARGAADAVAAAGDALAEVEGRLDEARARLAVRRADARALATAAEAPVDLDTLLAHARGDDLARAVRAHDRAEARVAELDDTYGERHPVLVAAERERRARRAEVEAAIAALVDAARRDEARQREVVAELEAAREERAGVLAERRAEAERRASLRAERVRLRRRTDALAATRADLVAERTALAPDARLLVVGEPAPVDGARATAVLYGGGAAGGLVLGALAGFVRGGRVPGRLDSDDDLALASPLPVWARTALPTAKSVAAPPDEGLQRLALRLEGAARPPRRLALVAPTPGPETGRVAVGLARALARERLAVAVVALEPDPALVPRALRRTGAPDLDAVLNGEARWSDAVRPLSDHGPWLVAPERRRVEPATRPALDDLLGELERRFDRVLVAGGGLERARTLRAARACREVLVAVTRGRTRGRDLAHGLAELEAIGVSPGGLVVLG